MKVTSLLPLFALSIFISACSETYPTRGTDAGPPVSPPPPAEAPTEDPIQKLDCNSDLHRSCGWLWIHDLDQESIIKLVRMTEKRKTDPESSPEKRIVTASLHFAEDVQTLLRGPRKLEVVLESDRARAAYIWFFEKFYTHDGYVVRVDARALIEQIDGLLR